MRLKHYSIIFLTSLFFLTNISLLQAQNLSIVGKAPNVSGRVINKVPYNHGILPGILANTAYCDDATAAWFLSVPIPTGTPFTSIDSLPGLAYGGAFVDTLLYVVKSSNLETISITTGAETVIAPITGVASGFSITSLAFRQPAGPMYLGATNITKSLLYKINLQTAAATFIDTITNCPGLITFSMNCTGDLYAAEIVNDNLVKIDTATGAGTIIGPLGINLNYAQGSSFDLSTGTLYLAAYTSDCALYTVNLSTGTATLVTPWTGREIVAFGIAGTCQTQPQSCDVKAGPFLSLPPLILPQNFYAVRARITNMGTTTETNIPVKFFVNRIQYGSTLYIPSLDPGAFDTSTVFAWMPTVSGATQLMIVAALDCDTARSNDTVKLKVAVGCASVFIDPFTNGIFNWTITNNGGTCVWSVVSRDSRPYELPSTSVGNVLSADADSCGSGSSINSTATLASNINCTNKYDVYLEFDNDFYVFQGDSAIIDASYDGGSTWINLATWSDSRRSSHETLLMPEAANNPKVKVRFTSIQPDWDWWWTIDNVSIHACNLVGEPLINNGNTPYKYDLSQNYPNPFNPATVISYQIPKAGIVKLIVYDILGREVKVLVNESKPAGSYNVTFDGTSLASGLYLYRITSGNFTETKKMVLLK